MKKATSKKVDQSVISALSPNLQLQLSARKAIHKAGQTVKRLRQSKGLSQEDLASLVGTTQGAISDLERGVGSQGPTISMLDRIFTACGETLAIVAESEVVQLAGVTMEPLVDENLVVAETRLVEGVEALAKAKAAKFDESFAAWVQGNELLASTVSASMEGARTIGEVIIAQTLANTQAAFGVAQAMARASSYSEIAQLHANYWRSQFQITSEQAKYVFELPESFKPEKDAETKKKNRRTGTRY